MAEDILVIPPIRQSLEDLTSAKANELDQPLTERSWYLFWERGAGQINLNTDKLRKLVTYGTHAGRPPADAMPNGALYMETDRGGAIYQNAGGAWHYRAGTMYGTLSPDQRPTDLGVNDAGFDFRGTDVARQFLWSQSEWVEVTAAHFGLHAARPAPASITEGSLYCETDRSGVIYQNAGGAWRYRAGTMYGTLTPDQRPTDLGTNDGGFEFRGTDEQRHFIWSQTEWIEITSGPGADAVIGAANLVNPNVVTKVVAAGEIGESSIIDESPFIDRLHILPTGSVRITNGLQVNGPCVWQFVIGAANDAAAAAAGVPMLGMYHNAGALRFRIS